MPAPVTIEQSFASIPELAKGFVDIDHTLVFPYLLQPGQVIAALQQPIGGEGDFWLCGMQMLSALQQRPDLIELSGNVGMRIADDTGYRLQSDYLNIAFLTPINGNTYPWVIKPAHLFTAGTSINIDLQELSNIANVPNVVQILFRGRYRFREADVAKAAAQMKQNSMRQLQGLAGLMNSRRRW